MSNLPIVLSCVLSLLLAGCSSSPRRNPAPVPDWESPAAAKGPKIPASVVSSPQTTSNGVGADKAPAKQSAVSGPQPPAASGPNAKVWFELEPWAHETGLATYAAVENGAFPLCSLRSARGTLVIRAGSLAAKWNGTELRLGFAPQVIDGALFVHTLDLRKSIAPLFELSAEEPPGLIVIDPGHGGVDCGTSSVLSGPCEKDYTLDWALRVRELLAAKGFQVLLTRSSDVDLAVSNRVNFANDHRAALFLSLHFNSAGSNSAESGLETYCLTPAGMPSSLTRGYSDDAGQAFPNNSFDSANWRLATRVHRALLEANGHQDRGVRRARFPGVLRGQLCPAVLIEGGYLSNEREARLIATPAHRQKLAEAVVRALEAAEP